MDLSLPLAAEALMPHRLPMRLVDRLVDYDGDSGTVEAEVAPGNPLLDSQGRLDEVALAEMLAQAYALVKGYGARRDGEPIRKGFLVGFREFVCEGPARLGDRLRITVRAVADVEDFTVAEGEIWRGAERIAHGSLKLWIPKEGP
jgi:predicted hotdog family 3-hydroxylacyl-ACP dehydratase